MKERFSMTWNIGEHDAGKLIRQFVKEQQISKAALTDIKFRGGDILVNNQHVNVLHELKKGEDLTVFFPMEEYSVSLDNNKIPLTILYEDAYILVINKPPGMITIPSREHPSGSLANALMGYYEKIGLSAAPHIVTRLDRNTSGIVLVAKHRHIHHLFNLQQKNGRIHKEYVAIAEGVFAKDKGIIEAPIGRKQESIIERAVVEDGQYARTRYEVLKQYPEFAYVKLHLDTGRTHQIRVHLAFIGHPLLGDDLYGGSIEKIERHALHCQRISFTHPISGEKLSFTAELTDDMKVVLDKARSEAN